MGASEKVTNIPALPLPRINPISTGQLSRLEVALIFEA
jgi:hypothetical protein